MTQKTTLFCIDRTLTLEQVATGIAQALGVRREVVAALDLSRIDLRPSGWYAETDAAAVQVDTMRGDFPLEVSVAAREAFDMEAIARVLAPALGASLLTDEFGVDPMSDVEWTLVTPDGAALKVLTDGDEFGADDPAIVLLPEFRKADETHLRHAAAD